MQKPKVSVRRPPPTVDEFVAGTPVASGETHMQQDTSTDVQQGVPVDALKMRKGVKLLPSGRTVKRISMLMPIDVAQPLHAYCRAEDIDVSKTITEAVREWLARRAK